MIDSVRYVLALALVVLAPPAFGAWLFVHPLVRVWRSLGPRLCYGLLAVYYVATSATLFAVREDLLARRFRFDAVLATAGIVLLLVAVVLRIAVHRQLTLPIMFGRPEIDPRRGDRLLTGGIYRTMRHPRYVEAFFGIAGLALFTNYAAVWIVAAAYVPVMMVVIRMEERELAERFGPRWREYSAAVPCVLPKLRPGG